MTINKNILIAATIITFMGVIFLGQNLGFWQLINEDGVTGESLIMEVSKTYNIPMEIIYSTWNIPEDISPRTPLEEVKDLTGFSMGKFKVWASTYGEENPIETSPAVTEHEEIDYPDIIDEIKGTTTLKDITLTFEISIEEISTYFDLPQDLDENTQLKTLRDEYNVEISAIKDWLNTK